MQYMGSKNRIAKKLLPHILPHRQPGQCWVEPFVGSGGMIEHVDGWRVGADLDPYIIALHRAIQNGWVPPTGVTREFYQEVKNNKDRFPPALVAFLGYGVSFGGKWFGGFAQSSDGTDYSAVAKRVLVKSKPKMQDVLFLNKSYTDLEIPENSLIYCDPPYHATIKYKMDFDHDAFWQWCRIQELRGHTVFVSEYSAPSDFTAIFTFEHKTTMNLNSQDKRTEKLFRWMV